MSSAAIPAPPPDASATVRGLVNTGGQVFAGGKTFNGGVISGVTGGGYAFKLAAGNYISFNDGTDTALLTYTAATFASGMLQTAIGFCSSISSGQVGFGLANAGARLKFSSGGANDYFYSDGSSIITPAQLWITSENGIYLNAAGTKRIYFDGSVMAANGDFKAYGILSSTSNIVCGNDLTLGNTNSLAMGGTGGMYGVTGGDVHVYGNGLALDSYTNDAANAGNRTVNKARGKSAFAGGAAAVTITNSRVTAESQVVCTLEKADATLTQILRCIPAAGSFTVTGNANATAATQFSWVVWN